MSNFKYALEADPRWLKIVETQVGSLKYGVVQIVIHDSRVVQIERTEKFRLDQAHANSEETERVAAAGAGWPE
jgi:hypothetical protein